MRIRGFPFGQSVEEFLAEHDRYLRGRAEPRRAAAVAAHASRRRCRRRSCTRSCVYGGFPLSGHARGRGRHQPARIGADRHMPSIAKPQSPHPHLRPNKLGLTLRDYEGSMSTLCAGCGHDSITAAIVRAFWELDTPPHMLAKLQRHRLLVEDADLLRQRRARLQLGARAHAGDRDRRQRRQPRADLHRHLGRRRLALDRARPALPRHPPQRRHGLRHREQRRLRPDQGTVLGVGGRRVEEQARRGQPVRAHRPGARWRSTSARRSWRAASRATRRSWCRS